MSKPCPGRYFGLDPARPALLLGVVEDDSQGVPMATANAADAVAQVHAIHAAATFHWAMVHSEYDSIPLA